MSKIKTKKFRVSFADVFKPHAPFEGQEPKYALTMLFDKKDSFVSDLKAAIAKCAKEKWGDKIPKNIRTPLRDGSEKEGLEGFTDEIFYLRAKSKFKPGIVDKDLTDIMSEDEFYSGCYARATIDFFAYDNPANKGVGVTLYNIQKLSDGDRLGGGKVSAADDFAEDSTGPSTDDDLNNYM